MKFSPYGYLRMRNQCCNHAGPRSNCKRKISVNLRPATHGPWAVIIAIRRTHRYVCYLTIRFICLTVLRFQVRSTGEKSICDRLAV